MSSPAGPLTTPLLGLLTPRNKKRALGIIALAAAASYGASQYAKAQQRQRRRRQADSGKRWVGGHAVGGSGRCSVGHICTFASDGTAMQYVGMDSMQAARAVLRLYRD